VTIPDAFSRRATRSFLFVLAVAACSGAEQPSQDTATAPPMPTTSSLAGVVGHWTDTTIGSPAIVVNGESWSGQTTRESLDTTSRRLFNEVTDTFISNMTSPTAFPIAVAGDILAFTSGTVRAEFNLVGGKSDQIAGIVFGLQPNGEYYYVRYNTKDGNVALWRYRNGDRENIAHGDVHKQLPLGTWHELVLEVRGRDVHGFVAGDTTISVRHTLDVEPVGRVGVYAKRDAITAFRSFRVQR
jgi:hypothetical protein